jgi:replicative DNA helicase
VDEHPQSLDETAMKAAHLHMVETLEPLANIEAEAALLGALMLHNDLLPVAAARVVADDFIEPLHGEIYDLIVKLVAAGSLATPITMRPHFVDHFAMAQLGGPGYLAQLTGNQGALIGAKDFAEQIADLSKRRALLVALDDARARVLDCGEDLQETVAEIDGAMSTAIRSENDVKSRTIAKAWDSAMVSIDAISAGTAPVGWWIDGLSDWNNLLGGMRPGNLIILAGRPGMGKTALAIGVAVCAARAGIGTDFFTLEMSEEELLLRAISDVCFDYDRGSFTYSALQRGKLNAVDRSRIDDARQMINEWPLRFYEPPSSKIGRIIIEMRRRKRAATAKGLLLDIFVIDYLQLMRGDKDRDNKSVEVGEITRDLKLAAKELGVAVILLSQLNRGVEQREDKRPQMSDLRDSGSIEQDADAIIFVYREQHYLEASEPPVGHKSRDAWETSLQACRDRVELIARKVRKGKTGTKTCQFFLAHQAIRGSNFFTEGRS